MTYLNLVYGLAAALLMKLLHGLVEQRADPVAAHVSYTAARTALQEGAKQ